MRYSESPPVSQSDKAFVDDMVRDFITMVCLKETLLEMIIMNENMNPAAIEQTYEMLTETDTNVDQINIILKSKIEY